MSWKTLKYSEFRNVYCLVGGERVRAYEDKIFESTCGQGILCDEAEVPSVGGNLVYAKGRSSGKQGLKGDWVSPETKLSAAWYHEISVNVAHSLSKLLDNSGHIMVRAKEHKNGVFYDKAVALVPAKLLTVKGEQDIITLYTSLAKVNSYELRCFTESTLPQRFAPYVDILLQGDANTKIDFARIAQYTEPGNFDEAEKELLWCILALKGTDQYTGRTFRILCDEEMNAQKAQRNALKKKGASGRPLWMELVNKEWDRQEWIELCTKPANLEINNPCKDEELLTT